MNSTSSKGNSPERWEKLLESLDEKLQLGLLDKLKKITAYHFEADILYIQPGSPEDEEYLKKDSVLQQLEFLAQDAVKVEKVKLKKME
jgi:hypothetical protein